MATATHAISFKVNTAEKKRIRIAAINREVSTSELVSEAVFKYLDTLDKQKSGTSGSSKKTAPASDA